MDIELRCNQQPCRKPVTDKAVVVSPSVLSPYTEPTHFVFRPHVREKRNIRLMVDGSRFFVHVGSHIFCRTFSSATRGGETYVPFKLIAQTRHLVPRGCVLVSLCDDSVAIF